MTKAKSRAEKAGEAMGSAIMEMVNLMYQNNTAKNFWRGFAGALPNIVGERQNEIHKEALKKL